MGPHIIKNRFVIQLPDDHSRVILRRCDDKSESDYINANYIRAQRLNDSTTSVQSSNESLDSIQSMILRNETKKSLPLVSKSLSDDALREVKKCIRLDKLNGNVCRDFVKDKMYIATQGCLPNTINDFWRMIWQEDVRVIAMITNEVEKGKKKCERYWPLCGNEERYDSLQVKNICETCHEDYMVREMDVSDDKISRTIYQYQFMTWPDHGTPEEAVGVLTFIDDINGKMYQITQSNNAPEQNILCIHCSAGVGRTGTFIALDTLIDKIKSSGVHCDIDVHDTVRWLRAQRNGLVQNRAQYQFLYLALQDYIENNNLKLMKRVRHAPIALSH
ncbi:tyrosine-protein phosphatase non-receptor type 11-like [Hyposmocoma kahamanoa]|uniref:tyrosine-protein phosphatase non-receptor type 11-like n=1 Tax=Hyposmocoma kahamanoa TaxID=1477025 RepID=UPI000E6D8D11|nr:tyrosine-protein phosphatase non-receptor type 11-like [Hyposmocoma kahamanoa]